MASVQKLRDIIKRRTLKNYETEGAERNIKSITTLFNKEMHQI